MNLVLCSFHALQSFFFAPIPLVPYVCWGDMLGIFSGVLGVWLMARQNIWTWWWGIINVIIYAIMLPSQGFIATSSLQILYAGLGIYGWYRWKHPQLSQKSSHTAYTFPQRLPLSTALHIGILTCVLWGIIAYILLYSTHDSTHDSLSPTVIIIDSFLTAGSLTTTYLETRKYYAAWIGWIIIDSLYAIWFFTQHLPLTSILYSLYVLLAIYGWYSWKNQYPHNLSRTQLRSDESPPAINNS